MKRSPPSLLVAVVDDDESVRSALLTAFRSVGLDAVTFSSAEAFLNFGRSEEIGFLITDLRMPGMSGLQLQATLVEGCRKIPTIFMTAHAEPRAREQAMMSGAVDFLCKPFDDNLLLETVQRILKLKASRRSGQSTRNED